MSIDVENSILFFLERTAKRGRIATQEEIHSLVRDCAGIFPDWYAKLLLKYPICGLELGWQRCEPEGDFDGINWMKWSDSKMMRAETLESYPGVAIYKHGYLNVASCSHGSGDPYFINTDEGENPRVLQVFHDVSDKYEVIVSEGIEVVAGSLSEFFRNARI